MPSEDESQILSPTVMEVINQFMIAIHNDDEIDDIVCDRLEQLVRMSKVPKPNEIKAMLFETPPDGES